jgi:hypothetical protein
MRVRTVGALTVEHAETETWDMVPAAFPFAFLACVLYASLFGLVSHAPPMDHAAGCRRSTCTRGAHARCAGCGRTSTLGT